MQIDETKDLTIEESFEALEEILEKMEDTQTGLEDSFQLYEKGLGLIRAVGSSIDQVEKRIRILEEEAQV